MKPMQRILFKKNGVVHKFSDDKTIQLQNDLSKNQQKERGARV